MSDQEQLQKINDEFDSDLRSLGLRETIEKLTKERDHAVARQQALQTKSSAERASSDRGHTEEIKALRTKQLHEIAELNESFQGKLIVLKDHIGDLKNKIRDSEASRLGQVSELQNRYNVDIGDMVAKNKTEVGVLKAEVEKLRSKLEVAERDKAENSTRAENDCHKLEIRLNRDHNIALHEKQNQLDEVSAQVQLLKSKKDFLHNEISKLRSQITEETNVTKTETQRCHQLVAEVDRLAGELSKKDSAISELRSKLQSAEDDNCNSKKDLGSVMAKCAEIASQIKPLEDAIKVHETEKEHASKDLRTCQKQTELLNTKLADNVQTLKHQDAKIRSLHSVIRNRERHIKSIEGEIEILAGLSDDKALKREVVAMYQKHIKNENKNPNNCAK